MRNLKLKSALKFVEMKKITKRDVAAFFLGMLFLFFLDTVLNWEDAKNAFAKGYQNGFNSTIKK